MYSPNGYFEANLQFNFSVISVPGKLPAPPGFLPQSECGCNIVSCTLIDHSVIRSQAADRHVGCVGGFFYSQCGLAFEHLIVSSITISSINRSNPFQALPKLLPHPVYAIISECVARSLIGPLHRSPMLMQLSTRLLQVTLGVDTCEQKGRVDVIVNSVPLSSSNLENFRHLTFSY